MTKIILILAILLPSFTYINAQNINDIRSINGHFDIKIRQSNFQSILAILSRNYNIPIGFQVSDNEELVVCKARHDLNLNRADIREVMDKVVSFCPTYNWEVVSGVVNISPAIRQSTILDIRINTFQVRKKSRHDVLDTIFNSEEIISEIRLQGLVRDQTTGLWGDRAKEDVVFNFTLTDVSVRDILNHLIANTEKKAWIYYRLSNDKSKFSLGFF